MSGELFVEEGKMLSVYHAEVQLQAHQHTLERALAHRSQLREARAAQVQERARRWTVPSRVLIALGTQFIAWGDRLHPTQTPVAKS